MPKTAKKRKFKYEVQDHGNGYMILRKQANALDWPQYEGVTPDEARKVLAGYIGKKARKYGFARPMEYEGKSACWLSRDPGEYWDGAEVRSDAERVCRSSTA